MRSQFVVEPRHDPVAAGEHLRRAACVARFVAIPQPRPAEVRKQDDPGDNTNQPRMFYILSLSWSHDKQPRGKKRNNSTGNLVAQRAAEFRKVYGQPQQIGGASCRERVYSSV